MAGLQSGWLPSPALCGGSLPLVFGAPGSLKLVLTYWWVEPDSRVGSYGARGPRSSDGLLVCRTSSWHGWLWGLGNSKAGVASLVSEAGSHCWWLRVLRWYQPPGEWHCGPGIPELVPVHWYVRMGPGSSVHPLVDGVSDWRVWWSWSWCWLTGGQGWGPEGPEASAGSLIGRAGSQVLWLQGPRGPGSIACALVCGAKSQALWWAGPCFRAAVGSGGLKEGGAVSLPG